MKIFIVAGQSTMYGLDILKPANDPRTKEEYRNESTFWYPIYKNMGYDMFVNTAQPGDSIDACTRKILTVCARYPDAEKFVLCGIPAGELFEVYDREAETYKNIIFEQSSNIVKKMEEHGSLFSKRAPKFLMNIRSEYENNVLEFRSSLKAFFMKTIALQSILKQLNIPYKFMHSVPPAMSESWDAVNGSDMTYVFSPFIDKDNFIDYMTEDVMSYTTAHSAKLGKHFHALEDGHRAYYEKIKHHFSVQS